MKKILRVENISKQFSGLQVINRVNLEIFQDERHAIIGPNGAGKSTLFNLISGLYKPNKGKILFKGKNIAGWPPYKISRLGLSRSFQTSNIYNEMTVYENIRNAIVSKFDRRFNWVTLLDNDKKIQKEIDKILEYFDLNSIGKTVASELSYGMQRQLELVLAIATDPTFLMLDEPTAGLTKEESKKIVKLIRKITENKTLVIIEHDLDVVFSLVDRITVLNYGQILATDQPDEIRQNGEIQKAYLGEKKNDP